MPSGTAPDFVTEITARARAVGASMLVVRAGMVFGRDHLASALLHAKRAFDEATNSADSLEMETLLYASGERQLSSAIAKIGVTEETREVVVARLSGDGFQPDAGWELLGDRPTRLSVEQLRAFGISDAEISTVPESRVADLVLERVAAVDVLKR